MDIIQEHDINTGKIFFGIYHQRFYKNKQYENDLIYREILDSIEIILKKHNVVSEKWEDMSAELRERYFNDNLELDISKTFFLVKRRQEPAFFDKINYNTNCVFDYDEKDKQKSFVFRQFFGLKISFTQLLEIYDFLDYQLKKNFKNDKDKYFDFLENVLMEHHKLIDSGKIEKVKEYLTKFTTTDLPIKIDEKFDFPLKAYSPIELQTLYNVSPKTFSAWLKPFSKEIGKLRGRKYTIKQVKVIFSKIDTPEQE